MLELYEWLTCPICFWEEYGLDVDRLGDVSPSNGTTLREERLNFNEFDVWEVSLLPLVLPPNQRKKYKHYPCNVL